VTCDTFDSDVYLAGLVDSCTNYGLDCYYCCGIGYSSEGALFTFYDYYGGFCLPCFFSFAILRMISSFDNPLLWLSVSATTDSDYFLTAAELFLRMMINLRLA
jgi:hypothetical protein